MNRRSFIARTIAAAGTLITGKSAAEVFSDARSHVAVFTVDGEHFTEHKLFSEPAMMLVADAEGNVWRYEKNSISAIGSWRQIASKFG